MSQPSQTTRVAHLPDDTGWDRRVGVEIEFAGLSEDDAARIIRQQTGGSIRSGNAGPVVDTDTFGAVEVYLDTRYKDAARAVDISRLVVPVELVTEPFPPDRLPQLDAVCDALAQAGATGTQDGMLLGFGVHLNVATGDASARRIQNVVTAFALAESWLRSHVDIDVTRRVLPFTAPYPAELLDALCSAPAQDMNDFARRYLSVTADRNHGLDMLPVLACAVPDLVARATDDPAVSARPAYHYRLPDSRVGDPGWTVLRDWNRWAWIETLAACDATMDRLRAAWREHREGLLNRRAAWDDIFADIVAGSGMPPCP